MAKKNNVVLENVELKPQVIGNVYKKRSNLGRVIFIFIVFVLVIYYIDDVSVFINDLIGRNSAPTIKNNSNNNDNPDDKNNNDEGNINIEPLYNEFSNGLTITFDDIVFSNFQNTNNKFTFDVTNTSNVNINYANKKIFMETYNTSKTLLERIKLDIGTLATNSTMSFDFASNSPINYIVVTEKTKDDYPNVNLVKDNNQVSKLTCTKDTENIVYTFSNDELQSITHTISDNNTLDSGYNTRYTYYQNLMTSYNSMSGISTTFNSTTSGFTAIISINLQSANITSLNNHYYYPLKEEPKVIDFEMKTYGFNCN